MRRFYSCLGVSGGFKGPVSGPKRDKCGGDHYWGGVTRLYGNDAAISRSIYLNSVPDSTTAGDLSLS